MECAATMPSGAPGACYNSLNSSGGSDAPSVCFRIAPVRTANDLASTVRLFRAYASSLDIDLTYQDFEAEMEAMPGKYAPPGW